PHSNFVKLFSLRNIPGKGWRPACIAYIQIGDPSVKQASRLGRILFLVALAVAPSAVSAQSKKEPPRAVPGWGMDRRPQRGGVATATGYRKEWPRAGPPLAWKLTGIGGGYSGVSVVGKFGYTMGEDGGTQVIIAFTVADGKIVWKAKVSPTGNPDNRGPGP